MIVQGVKEREMVSEHNEQQVLCGQMSLWGLAVM